MSYCVKRRVFDTLYGYSVRIVHLFIVSYLYTVQVCLVHVKCTILINWHTVHCIMLIHCTSLPRTRKVYVVHCMLSSCISLTAFLRFTE